MRLRVRIKFWQLRVSIERAHPRYARVEGCTGLSGLTVQGLAYFTAGCRLQCLIAEASSALRAAKTLARSFPISSPVTQPSPPNSGLSTLNNTHTQRHPTKAKKNTLDLDLIPE